MKLKLREIPLKRYGPLSIRILPTPGKLKSISAIRISVPPQQSHPPVLHQQTDELAVVLKGSGTGLIGKQNYRLKAGDCITIQAGTWHEFRASPMGMEVLAVFSPAVNPTEPDMIYKTSEMNTKETI